MKKPQSYASPKAGIGHKFEVNSKTKEILVDTWVGYDGQAGYISLSGHGYVSFETTPPTREEVNEDLNTLVEIDRQWLDDLFDESASRPLTSFARLHARAEIVRARIAEKAESEPATV